MVPHSVDQWIHVRNNHVDYRVPSFLSSEVILRITLSFGRGSFDNNLYMTSCSTPQMPCCLSESRLTHPRRNVIASWRTTSVARQRRFQGLSTSTNRGSIVALQRHSVFG